MIACLGDGAMQMLGINALIDIARYSERWSNRQTIMLVLHNDDLNQVTWEQRVMSGDAKLEVSQVLPDFPYARYAELLGIGASGSTRRKRRRGVGRGARRTAAPCVIEAITDPEVPPLPPHIRFEQATGLAKALRARRSRAPAGS